MNTPGVVKALAEFGAKLRAHARLRAAKGTTVRRGDPAASGTRLLPRLQSFAAARAVAYAGATMELTAIKAKIAAGVLPKKEDVAIRPARYVSGICVACDTPLRASDVSVEFFVSDGGRCLLHTDCYVMWTQACAETRAATELCKVCGETIRSGTPHYRLGGGLASVHVECRDAIKPQWPRS